MSIILYFSLIFLSSFLTSLVNLSSKISFLIINFWLLGFKTYKASTCFFHLVLQLLLFLFSNALQAGEYVNLVCYVILLWSDGNIYSLVRYLFLSILSDGNANIFAASLLISYCTFYLLLFLKNPFWSMSNYLVQEQY